MARGDWKPEGNEPPVSTIGIVMLIGARARLEG
jgi:hypothetical protein